MLDIGLMLLLAICNLCMQLAHLQLSQLQSLQLVNSFFCHTAANLTGTLPSTVFTGLPDLSIIFLGQNPGMPS